MVPCERSCHKEYIYEIWKLYHFWLRFCHKQYTCAIWKLNHFWQESYDQGYSSAKVGQTSRSRSRGQKLWYHVKGLVISNTHVQYESCISSGKYVMDKVKVFFHAHTRTPTLGLWHKLPGHLSHLAKNDFSLFTSLNIYFVHFEQESQQQQIRNKHKRQQLQYVYGSSVDFYNLHK